MVRLLALVLEDEQEVEQDEGRVNGDFRVAALHALIAELDQSHSFFWVVHHDAPC